MSFFHDMTRAGRKRKAGHRYKSGNIKQPNAAQRHKTAQELIDLEKAVVLVQPHRCKSHDQLIKPLIGKSSRDGLPSGEAAE
jgi:hypothetical protein